VLKVSKGWLLALGCLVTLVAATFAENQVMSELRFTGAGNAEKNAGVWVDGQYVGYVNELKGDRKIMLLPGKHEIIVRQAWYRDYVEQAVLEPGELHIVQVSMAKLTPAATTSATAELKISAVPTRAVVFVDDQFAGHVDEFDGMGKALLLIPGEHRIRISLPGYQSFETSVNLKAKQKLKIKTELMKGSITEAGPLVSAN